MCICTYVHMCMCVYIYIYIYSPTMKILIRAHFSHIGACEERPSLLWECVGDFDLQRTQLLLCEPSPCKQRMPSTPELVL